MKKQLRIAVLIVSVLGVSLNSYAVQGNPNHCPPDPDSGALICKALCYTATSCLYNTNNPVGTYCWVAYAVSGGAIACHNGQYDPCCDPNYQW